MQSPKYLGYLIPRALLYNHQVCFLRKPRKREGVLIQIPPRVVLVCSGEWSNVRYPLVNHNYGKSPSLMGKLTISMAMFNSFFYVYQAGYPLVNDQYGKSPCVMGKSMQIIEFSPPCSSIFRAANC